MKKAISLLLLIAILASLSVSFSSCALFADNGGESESSSEKESASEPIAEENAFTVTLAEYDEAFNTLGEKFPMQFGHWKGVHVGLYCYNVNDNAGVVSFDDFEYHHDGPKID